MYSRSLLEDSAVDSVNAASISRSDFFELVVSAFN